MVWIFSSNPWQESKLYPQVLSYTFIFCSGFEKKMTLLQVNPVDWLLQVMLTCWLANHSATTSSTIMLMCPVEAFYPNCYILKLLLVLCQISSWGRQPWLLGELWCNCRVSTHWNSKWENNVIEHKVIQVLNLLILLWNTLLVSRVSNSPGVANWALICESRS